MHDSFSNSPFLGLPVHIFLVITALVFSYFLKYGECFVSSIYEKVEGINHSLEKEKVMKYSKVSCFVIGNSPHTVYER